NRGTAINEAKRIFALHFDESSGENLSMIAVNPKIVSHSVEKAYLAAGEGCLSVDRAIPGYVPRYARVTIKAFNLDGEEFKMRLKGLPAIAFQHELDHLNGVMFFDHIDSKNPFAEIENAIAIERDSAEYAESLFSYSLLALGACAFLCPAPAPSSLGHKPTQRRGKIATLPVCLMPGRGPQEADHVSVATGSRAFSLRSSNGRLRFSLSNQLQM